MTVYMTPVTSSQIASVGYDEDKRELHVRFKNGALYVYSAVPQDVYDGLLAADSVGSTFHTTVRNGGFKYRRG